MDSKIGFYSDYKNLNIFAEVSRKLKCSISLIPITQSATPVIRKCFWNYYSSSNQPNAIQWLEYSLPSKETCGLRECTLSGGIQCNVSWKSLLAFSSSVCPDPKKKKKSNLLKSHHTIVENLGMQIPAVCHHIASIFCLLAQRNNIEIHSIDFVSTLCRGKKHKLPVVLSDFWRKNLFLHNKGPLDSASALIPDFYSYICNSYVASLLQYAYQH